MARIYPFSIDVAGRRWSGDWSTVDGEVLVGSAYGSKRAPLGRAKAENVAVRLLKEIVAERGR